MAKLPVKITKESYGSSIHILEKIISGVKLEVGIFTCDKGKSLDKHDHGDLSEWCYILEGDAIFEIENEKTLVKKGEMIHLPAQMKHLSYPANEETSFTSLYIICRD